MEDTTPKGRIFRFKFDDEFSVILNGFAKLHRYDNRLNFNDAWETWCDEHQCEITKETRRLLNMEYEGDVLIKMYKSARYYYRKKLEEKKEPKPRREYVSLCSSILVYMDIIINGDKLNETPSDLYYRFCKKYSDELVIEMTRLLTTTELIKEEIGKKIKKTFKNRYFNIKRNI